MLRAEPGDQADDDDEQSLNHRDRRAAQRSADHDVQTWHRCDERLFEKTELPVPQESDSGENRREQYGHADDAGRDKLQVATLSGLLEYRAQTESERLQVQEGLPQRGDTLRPRSRVTLDFPEPQDVNRAH